MRDTNILVKKIRKSERRKNSPLFDIISQCYHSMAFAVSRLGVTVMLRSLWLPSMRVFVDGVGVLLVFALNNLGLSAGESKSHRNKLVSGSSDGINLSVRPIEGTISI